jgi:uncharacterized protein (TIGR03437 family)
VDSCREPHPPDCSTSTGITLQIPFELAPILDTPGPGRSNTAWLTFSENEKTSATVELVPLVDRIHVLREGDTITRPGVLPAEQALWHMGFLDPLVTHADGSVVTPVNPGKPGETLVLYAVGLGPTDPPAKSGEVTKPPVPTVNIRIRFDFLANGSPSSPGIGPLGRTPAFAGLTPGFVGLYQVNLVVPEPPATLDLCRGSNLTVSIGRVHSFDGVGICIDARKDN